MGMLAAEKLKMNCLSGFLPPMSAQLFKRPALLMILATHPSGMQVNMQFVNGLTMPHIMIFKKLTPEEEADVRQFEGNAQGLRLLTRIDYHPDDGGMRLTYATLGAYLKYPWLSKQSRLKVIVHHTNERNLVVINLKRNFKTNC